MEEVWKPSNSEREMIVESDDLWQRENVSMGSRLVMMTLNWHMKVEHFLH
jgi:hypothetical protein